MAQNDSTNRRGRLFLLILIPIVLLIGGGATYLVLTSEDGFLSIGGVQEPEEVHIPLEEFLVNIEGNSLVRMEMTVSSYDENAEERIGEEIAKVRDAVIHVLSNRPASDFYEEEEGEFILKHEIKDRINQSLGEEVVDDVFITNILMQG